MSEEEHQAQWEIQQQEAGQLEASEPQEGGEGQLEEDEAKLDVEADALLKELADSQAEVARMLRLQKDQATELGGLKDKLAAELHELQDEAWKLQVFGELEALKRQLQSLNNLEADLDAAEAVLDATEAEKESGSGRKLQGASNSSSLADGEAGAQQLGAAGEGEGEADEDDTEYDAAEIEALQAKLDAELGEMFAQLQSVRSEAATVSARKAQLEAELKDLLALQMTDADMAAMLEKESGSKTQLSGAPQLEGGAMGGKGSVGLKEEMLGAEEVGDAETQVVAVRGPPAAKQEASPAQVHELAEVP